jgi:anti-sigma B factor antagonist
MPAFTIRTLSAPAASSASVLIAVAGDIDIASAPQLRGHLETLDDRDVVLDMSGVTLLAAAGLHVLLDLKERLSRAGAHLVLASPADQVRRVLAATGLDETLATASSVVDAVSMAALDDAPQHRHNGARRLRLIR